MTEISPQHLQPLLDRGLCVSIPFPPDHASYPNGVCVGKPVGVPGNSIPNYTTGFMGGAELDGPWVVLCSKDGAWFVSSYQGVPSPVEGDFETHWSTAEQAVEDILDYYFGSPRRMAPRVERWLRTNERIERFRATQKLAESKE